MNHDLLDLDDNPPGYMSEQEVRQMLGNYNANLEQFTNQIDELSRRNTFLEQRLVNEQHKRQQCEEELNRLQVNYHRVLTELELAKDKLERQQDEFQSPEITGDGILLELDNQGLSQVSQQKLDELKTYIPQLQETNRKLLAENARLKSENVNLQRSELEEQICKHCRQAFIPRQNYDGACRYHPGKQKYYSCKGCGEDAYFTCCNRCLNCLKGCKEFRHVA